MGHQVVHGSSTNSIEEAIQEAVSTAESPPNHMSGEVLKITLDVGGVRGGIEYRVEVRLVG